MKQLLKIFAGAVFAILGCAGFVRGDQDIAHDYRFSAPSLIAVTNGYTQIAVQDCSIAPQPGAPQLPFRTVKLLLPAGALVSSVTAEPLSVSQPLAESIKVDFGRTPRSPAVPFAGADEPDPAIYNSTNWFPAATAELVSVQRMDGCDIAIIRLYPLRYAPVPGQLIFTPELRVTVNLNSSVIFRSFNLSATSASSVAAQKRVAAFVDNPEQLSTGTPMSALAPADAPVSYDYLIVSSAALMPYFQPLIDLKIADGLTVTTETMTNIVANYSGRDNAEKLRNFIRYAHTTWGVQYVLLGGDISVVPYRGVYARCSGVTLNAMPSDLYFACLDGSWNHDGDAIWGEPTDGETGGDVDLLPEVDVGRAPVETIAEVTNFVANCLAGEQSKASGFRACFAGEYLENGTAQGGNALDTLLPAFNNSLCPVGWLDDRPALSAVWTASDAINALNSSPLLVAHFGHGSDSAYDTTVMHLTAADLDALTNSTPFLLYSTACNAGAFDNDQWGADCIAEELVKHNRHGAFTVVANSREGWYDPQNEWRYSGEFQKRFFDRLLANEQTQIGAAHRLAKQDLLGSVETVGTSMPYRWCLFGINFFGDPHSAIRVPLSLRFRADSDECTVTWNSWSNRTYSVFSATDLVSQTWTCIVSNIAPTPPLNVWTNTITGTSRAFYRVIGE